MNKCPFLRLSAVALILACCFSANALFAANRTWTGGGSPTNFNWTIATNWGGTAPAASDLLFFDGSAGTVNTNDFALDTQFNGLTFNTGASAFTLLGNTLTIGSGITNSSANVQKVLLGLKYGASRTIDGGNSGLIIGGGLTNTTTAVGLTLTLRGTGTISNLLNSIGTTNIFATAGTANWTLVDNSSSAAVTLTTSSFTVPTSGVFSFGNLNSAPNLNITSGSGTDNGISGGTFNMVNGTLTTSVRFNTTGTGSAINVSGGTFNIGNQIQNANGAATDTATITVSGGTLNCGGTAGRGVLFVASRGQSSVTVSGGAIFCGTLDLSRNAAGNTGASKGTVNLNGGTMVVTNIGTATANAQTGNAGSATATVNFNGGTMRAGVAFVPFQGSQVAPVIPITAIVKSGGAFLDSSNFTFVIREPLQHDVTGAAIDGGLTKLGTGLLVLTNVNTYTGPTRINTGTLSLTNSGSIATSSKILVTSGATFDVSQVAGGFTLASGQLLGGNGTVNGAVTAGSGAGVSPGFSPGTLTLSSSLTLNGSTTNFFELSNTTSGANDKLIVAGNLTLNGLNTISVSKVNGSLQTGRYVLITYGSLSGSVSANLAVAGISTVGTRQIVYLTNDIAGEIDLVVAGDQPASLTWAGNGVNNNWDLTTTADWLTNGSPAQFFNDDSVGFGDSGSKSPAVNLVGVLAPASVTVSNATGSYAFSDTVSGSGKITGGGTLIKSGNGTLALFENAGDDFTGGIQVNGGTLVLSNNNVAISGGIAVNNGATLTDAHNGTIGGGIAVNNGSARIAGSAAVSGGVTLTTGGLTVQDSPNITGNVTVNGGTALLGGNGTVNGNILTGGGSTTITNTPSGVVNVTVNGGSLLLEQDSGASVPSGNTVIGGSGTLQLGNNDNRGALNLAGGSTLTDNGTFTVNRQDDINVDATVSGTGTFTQANTNTVTVTADNGGFTGPVSVQKGTLKLGNNRAFGTTTAGITVANGATLDLNTFTLTNASVIAGGSGVTNGGAIVNNGASGAGRGIRLLTLTTNITLGGISRWDLRNVGGTAILTNNNNPFGITKVGTNQVSIVNVSVDPALADIDVQQGLLSIEQTTTSAGNPSSNLIVRSGATLQLFQLQNPLNKIITLNGSGTNITLNGASGTQGSNIVVGPVTLNGDSWISVSGGANLTFSNNVIGGPGNFTKVGAGTNYLNGVASYSGVTTVSNGVLSINGTAPTNNISVYGDGSTVAGILSGTATLTQPVTIGDYGTLSPGNGMGTMSISNTVTFSANATNFMEIDRNASPNADLLRGVTTLNAAGTVLVNNLGVSPQYGDVFKLYDAAAYSGSFANVNLPTLTFPLLWNTSLLVDGTISVSIDPSGNLVWTGANGADWDTGMQNWKLAIGGAPANYVEPSGVQFDDSAVGPVNVNLTGTFAPVSLVISNNTKTYTFSGFGNLTGGVVLQKKNSGTLILDNSGINDFSGGAVISGGTLQVGNNDANGNFPATGPIINNGSLVLDRTDTITVSNVISGSGSVSEVSSGTVLLYGTNSYAGTTLINGTVQINNAVGAAGTSSLGAVPGGAVTIANGGTLDLGGNTNTSAINFTNANGFKQFFIAGSGAGGAGAIVNSFNINQQNAFQLITLTADAAFGGVGRWDMRGGPTNTVTGALNPMLNLAGHKLTKTGGNQISLVNVQVSSGDIQVDQGVASFEGSSAVNGTGTITVNPAGFFGHFRTWAGAITRPMTVNGGTITNLATGGGSSTNDSPITLTADSFISAAAGSDLYLNGTISGGFGLTKNGTGTIILPANPAYSGNITINAGTLQFGTNSTTGNLPASSSVTDNGTIAWNRSDDLAIVNSINGTGGIAQNGTNTLVLDNPGTLAGTTTIAGGVLQVGNNDALGSLPTGNITDNGMLVFKRADTLTVNGVVSGTGKIVQSGTNMVKLFGANTYTGGTLVTNGFLQVSNSTSLGTAGPGNITIVTNGGTLDVGGNVGVNNLALRAFTIQVSGAGVTNGGAIINSGIGQQNAFTNVTLVGNTTFGGGNRWDIRGTGSQLNAGGNPYKLTKVGTNFIGLVNVTVDPAIGDVDVQNGILDFETGTTGLGNASSNLFIRAGAALEMWQAINALNKVITIFGDGVSTNIILGSGSGGPTNTITGPIVLTAGSVVIGGNAPGNISNVISGAQGLIINGGTGLRVNLAGTNAYTGNTLVTAGTLSLLGSSQLTNSPVITIASTNATIDVSGRTTPNSATLVVGANQTLYGNGSIVGNLGVNAGGLVSPGAGAATIGTLNVSVSVTTSGRLLMELNKSNPGPTNDLITCAGPFVCGGTLSVTNLGPALVAGDTFKLFSPSSFLGGFTLDLADPGPNLAWSTNNLYVDGSLTVVSGATGPTTNATITKVTLSGTNLLVHGTNNNVPNTSFHYVVLTTTNLTNALANWVPVVTNTFNVDGTFDYTNPIVPGTPRQFIDIKAVP